MRPRPRLARIRPLPAVVCAGEPAALACDPGDSSGGRSGNDAPGSVDKEVPAEAPAGTTPEDRALHSTAEEYAQRLRFFDPYRAYVINDNLGQELVRSWVEAQGGTAEDRTRRWEDFQRLLSTPRLPADLH